MQVFRVKWAIALFFCNLPRGTFIRWCRKNKEFLEHHFFPLDNLERSWFNPSWFNPHSYPQAWEKIWQILSQLLANSSCCRTKEGLFMSAWLKFLNVNCSGNMQAHIMMEILQLCLLFAWCSTNLTLSDPRGGAYLPPSFLIKEKKHFFKQLYLAN